MRHLTITEVAQELNLSVATVKRYIYDGRIQSVKLRGGQHRIPQSEVERLLGDAAGRCRDSQTASGPTEDRLAVLERWVAEQEAEIERLSASLEVLRAYWARCQPRQEEDDVTRPKRESGSRVLVLGPGCRRCDALYKSACSAVRSLGLDETIVARVEDLAEIASYGPVLTPALVIDGQIVVSGKVPTESTLRRTLAARLEA